MKARNFSPIYPHKGGTPALGLPSESTFVLYIYTRNKIKINGYIFMAQETSDNVWVSKKIFLWTSYKLLSFKEVSLFIRLNSTLVKHRAPCFGTPPSESLERQLTGVRFGALQSWFGDPALKGTDHILGTQSSPQPTNLWLKGNVRSECPPQPQGSLTGIWWPNLAQV